MCGLIGVIKQSSKIDEQLFSSMLQTINHRGPDDQGMWANENIALGHTRLSIHDLSEAGHQPMFSNTGRFVVVFNGEIYNYQTIKKEILIQHSIHFKSNSDTEVLVNAIDLWGIEETLKKCTGMFALAVWDKEERKLILARDRFGEKPLYYGHLNGDFVFSSELKPFQLGYKSNLEIDRNALASFMRYAYVPTPYCIYRDIHKLNPGSYIAVNKQLEVTEYQYWSSRSALDQPVFQGNYHEAINLLENKLTQILKQQMAADVPLGAFLSGGIDSSLIVSIMQKLSSSKIKTFSIGLYDKQFNEAEYAKNVAKHIGSEHSDLYVTEKDALSVIPDLPGIYDEPFADSSQIPTFLVSRLAKQSVTVSLSGDGADELFGGYTRYLYADSVRKNVLDKSLVRNVLSHMPTSILRWIGNSSKRYSLFADKLIKLQNVIRHSQKSGYSLYDNLCSQIYNPNNLVLNGQEYNNLDQKDLLDLSLSYQNWLMYADVNTYMMDDILTKVDRAAMANSLETRIPFLDHQLYEFAWQLPPEYKINNGVSKKILRDLLYKFVPKEILERPKMGFGVPLASWLRGELKEWAWELIEPRKVKSQGYLDSKQVLKYWDEHQSGKRNWQYALWNIISFQQWLDYQTAEN